MWCLHFFHKFFCWEPIFPRVNYMHDFKSALLIAAGVSNVQGKITVKKDTAINYALGKNNV